MICRYSTIGVKERGNFPSDRLFYLRFTFFLLSYLLETTYRGKHRILRRMGKVKVFNFMSGSET